VHTVWAADGALGREGRFLLKLKSVLLYVLLYVADGILTVTGSAEGTDIKQDISVRANKGRMSEEVIVRLQRENEEYEMTATKGE